MSYNIRGHRVAYSNIADGSATGKERTISGNGGTTEKYSGGERLKTSEGGVSTEPTSDFARDRIKSSEGGVTSLWPRENL
jgi:hypothetical protein